MLILSAYDDENYVRAALSAGVAGYLLKTMPSDELVSSIRAACDGAAPLEKRPSGRGERAEHDPGEALTAHLTVREQDVVRLVARGMSNKAIARQLGISPRTVEGHLNHVFQKLDTTSRTEFVHYALASRLFPNRPPCKPRHELPRRTCGGRTHAPGDRSGNRADPSEPIGLGHPQVRKR